MDDLEPILNMVDEGHSTEYDESDDLEDAKKVVAAKEENHPLYSGWFWCSKRLDFFRYNEWLNS